MSGCRALLCRRRTITTTQPLSSQPHHDYSCSHSPVCCLACSDTCPEAVGQCAHSTLVNRSRAIPVELCLGVSAPLNVTCNPFSRFQFKLLPRRRSYKTPPALQAARHSLSPGTLTARQRRAHPHALFAVPRSLAHHHRHGTTVRAPGLTGAAPPRST